MVKAKYSLFRFLRVCCVGLLLLAVLVPFPKNTAYGSADVTNAFQIDLGRPYYDYTHRQTYTVLSLTNTSQQGFDGRIRLVIMDITHSSVTAFQPDGLTSDAKPYIDLWLPWQDLDHSGSVNAQDWALISQDFGRTGCFQISCEGDLDRDGDVDGADLALFGADLGQGDGTLNPGERYWPIALRFNNPQQVEFNFTVRLLVDITEGCPIRVDRGRPYYDYDQKQTYTALTVTNTGFVNLVAPVRVLVYSAMPVANADGRIDNNIPYVDFSALLGDGTLSAGETSSAFILRFDNQDQLDFDFTTQALCEAAPVGEGFVTGEVYDDATGLPIAGAAVRALVAGGQPLAEPMSGTTDHRGRYRFRVTEGHVVLEASHAGYVTCQREADVASEGISTPLDIRMTPKGGGHAINSLTGGHIVMDEARIALYVPPGGVPQDTSVFFKKLTVQGLPGRLAPGWTPLCVLSIGPEDLTPNVPFELTVRGSQNLGGSGSAALSRLVAVRWDRLNRQWVRLAASPLSEQDGLVLQLSALGTVALVRPDTQPAAPPVPAEGQALTGVAPGVIPEGVTAEILPSPDVLFMQPGAKSNVRVRLNNVQLLPSGTVVEVDFDESYEKRDGTWIMPESMTQDILLYQSPTGFEGPFVASPSQVFDPLVLKEGVIRLTAHRPEGVEGKQIIGPSGGTVTTAGFSLTVPSGALPEAVPVGLQGLMQAPAGLGGSSFFEAIQGVAVDLGESALSQTASLSVNVETPLDAEDQVLVVRPVSVEGVTRYEWIGVAAVSGNTLTVSSDNPGLPLPGITEGGRYYFIKMTQPVGYVTGTVSSGDVPADNAVVRNDTLPFVSLTDGQAPQYALASTLGDITITGKSQTDGSGATAAATLDSRGQIATIDLALIASRPTVVSVTPANGATGVQTTATVTVRFSRQMNAATVNASSFMLRAGSSDIAGTVTLLPDKVTALFKPDVRLADETLYSINLTTDIEDIFGQRLQGNQPDGSFAVSFTTLDVTPPARPEAGQVTMSMPDDNGVVTISGTLGSVEPGTAVTAINKTTGTLATVLADDDGSFELFLAAGTEDTVELLLKDQAGNETIISPGLFDSGEGMAVVGAAGGTLRLPDGSAFTFASGSFEQPAEVTIERIEEQDADVPTPTDFGLQFAAGFTIDTGGEPLREPLKCRIPVSGSYSEDSKFLVSVVEDVGDEKRLVLVETAFFRDGAIEVNSPPMPGIGGSTYIGPAGPPVFSATEFLIHLLVLPNISFVMGHVYKAPPGAELSIAAPSRIESETEAWFDEEETVTATAKTSLHHAVTLSNLKIYHAVPNSNALGSELNATVVPISNGLSATATLPIDPNLVEEVESFVQNELIIQKQKRWIATVDVTIDGQTETLRADTSSEIVEWIWQESDVPNIGTAHTSRWIPGGMKPAVGAWVQGFNGVSDKYPCITQTNYQGGFILAAKPGSGYIRVFDPLTGKGLHFPVEIPYQIFGSYVDIDRIVVPEYFGDGQPPTLDVQASGSFEVHDPLTITLNATDDQGLDNVIVTIFGYDYTFPLSGTSSPVSFDYTPSATGDLDIKAIVYDMAGNRSTRRTLVTIKEPSSTPLPNFGGADILLQQDTINVDPEIGVTISLNPPAARGGIPLSDLRDEIEVHFEKTGDSAARIDAVGGTACGGHYLRIRPASPLPLNTDIDLVVDPDPGAGGGGPSPAAVRVHFRTKGIGSGGLLLNAFRDIRGLAVSGNYVYVANYGDTAADGIVIVDISDPTNPTIAGSQSFSRARGLDADTDHLVVVGGGGGSDVLPVLRYYSLSNPTSLAKIGTGVILFPLADQAVPSNVRLAGSLAFVSTVGLGLQSVDLNLVQQGAEMGQFQTGSAAIVGGFSLPNLDYQPHLGGTSYDAVANLSGLVLTGGLDSGLCVLSGTSGGFVSLIDQTVQGGPWPTLQFSHNMMRLAATSDFLIRKDTNGDGFVDYYQNINLAAVSHGSSGISLVDVSNPGKATLLSQVDTGSRVLDMAIVDGFIFTGDRMVSVYDPEHPIVSSQLSFKRPNGTEYLFTSGGDLAISTITPIRTGEKIVTFVSSDASKKGLQVGKVNIPYPGPDWDVVRTLPLEPYVNPDNEDYFNTGDPINPYTGEFVLTETDLTVPGRGLHFAFTRTYRSQNLSDGIMGYGWDHNYNSRLSVELIMVPDVTDPDYPHREGNVIVYDGSGRFDTFVLNSSGQYEAPPGHFAELKMLEADSIPYFELQESDGTVTTYRPSKTGLLSRYIMTSIEDRFGNRMEFSHNRQDQLTEVTDSLGRNFYFSYDIQGRLTAVTDYSGRTVSYRYDYDNNLIAVTDPAGRVTTYDYDCSHIEFDINGNPVPERMLNHNLWTVTDPKGQVYLENTYGQVSNSIDFDRVTSQRLGVEPDGGTFLFLYSGDTTTGKVTHATTTDRLGKTTDRYYDDAGHLVRLEKKGHVFGTETTITTRYWYTNDGLMEKVVSPRGVTTEFWYNPGASSRLRKGDLTVKRITPVGGGTPRESSYSYIGSAWGVPTAITDPAGHTTQYELDAGGLGLVKKIIYPLVTQADGSSQAITVGLTYNSYGQLLSKTDGDGVVTRYVYDYQRIDPSKPSQYLRKMKKIVDAGLGGTAGIPREVSGAPLQLETEATYNTIGNVIAVTDPRGNTTTYDVNDLNQVERMADWRGERHYYYDENDNLKKIEDLGGLVTEYVHDSLDLTRRMTESAPDTDGSTITRTTLYDYDRNERLTAVTLPLGNTISKQFDARGFPTKIKDNLGDIRGMTYDEDGNIRSVIDAEGHATTFEYNGFNELVGTTDPNGNYSTYEYDGRGILVAERSYDASDEKMKEKLYKIDELGRIGKIQENIIGGLYLGGPEETYEIRLRYDKANRITQTIDSLHRATAQQYDGLGRLVYERDAVGNERAFVFDSLELIQVTRTDLRPDGSTESQVTENHYDGFGRLVSRVVAPGTADERRLHYDYDQRDNVTRVETSGGVTTEMDYDGLNRLVRDSVGRYETNLNYDIEDHVVSELDQNEVGITFQYDERGRLFRTTYGQGTSEESSTTLSYWPDNHVRTFSDRAGNVFSYTYDDGNRMDSVAVHPVSDFSGTTAKSFSYDGLGRVIAASATSPSSSHSTTYTYNSRGDVVRRLEDAREVLAHYNIAGENTRLEYPSAFEIVKNYDSLGRLQDIGADGSSAVQYQFFGPTRIASALFGNGTRGELIFRESHQEGSRTYYSTSGTVQTGFSTAYDGAGRVSGFSYDHRAGSGDIYSYTDEGWIKDVKYGLPEPFAPDAGSQTPAHYASYTYDSNGNRLVVSRDGLTEDYEVNPLNQYTTVGGETLAYDGNGNLKETKDKSFIYDVFGNLLRVTDKSTAHVLCEYEYDALGRRVKRSFGTSTEIYVYEGNRPIAVYDGSNQLLREYIYGDEIHGPIAMRRGGNKFYYQYDQRGSVVAITDDSGVVVERYMYDVDGRVTIFDASGSTRTVSAIDNDFGFIGCIWEESSGLLHLGAREYDPEIGRFLQPDPAGTINGLNLYAYAGNDPVNFTDLTGLYRQASIGNVRPGSLVDYGFSSNPLVMELTDIVNLMAVFTTLPWHYDYREFQNISELGSAFVSEGLNLIDVVSTVLGAPQLAKGIFSLAKGVATLVRDAVGEASERLLGRAIRRGLLRGAKGVISEGTVVMRLPDAVRSIRREMISPIAKELLENLERTQRGIFVLDRAWGNSLAHEAMAQISWATRQEVGYISLRTFDSVGAAANLHRARTKFAFVLGEAAQIPNAPRGTRWLLAHTHPSGTMRFSPGGDIPYMLDKLGSAFSDRSRLRGYIIDPDINSPVPPVGGNIRKALVEGLMNGESRIIRGYNIN